MKSIKKLVTYFRNRKDRIGPFVTNQYVNLFYGVSQLSPHYIEIKKVLHELATEQDLVLSVQRQNKLDLEVYLCGRKIMFIWTSWEMGSFCSFHAWVPPKSCLLEEDVALLEPYVNRIKNIGR